MIAQSLLQSRTASLHGATRHEAEQKGFYRFLDIENIGEDILFKELTNRWANSYFEVLSGIINS